MGAGSLHPEFGPNRFGSCREKSMGRGLPMGRAPHGEANINFRNFDKFVLQLSCLLLIVT